MAYGVRVAQETEKMEGKSSMAVLLLVLSFSLLVYSHSSSIPESFIHCLSLDEFASNVSNLDALHVPSNSSYPSILESRSENLRLLLNSTTQKPLTIITPESYSHVQTAVKCCKHNGLQIRIRSGGHDFEGSSYTSDAPFVMVDMRNLRAINVDIEDNSAWVESGATIGELYYAIAEKSPIHGFPAGLYATVGVGGHFSSGGVGNLIRKYGLSVDNVIDAKIVDANGRIMDRKLMGADLFWAIRGGGGGSFGVTVAWKIKLVQVPPIVTVFMLSRTSEQGAIDLIHKWQDIAHKVHDDLLLRVVVSRLPGTQTTATFQSLFLGRADDLLTLMEESFPEIGLRKEDCTEMSWIEAVIPFSMYRKGETVEVLKNGVAPLPTTHFKGKGDVVYKPIPQEAWKEFWKRCSEPNSPPLIQIEFHPYGGRMNEISISETPYAYREGVLFEIFYIGAWIEDKNGESSKKYMSWMSGLYEFMTPFVSTGPRGGLVNVRDFDLGTNDGSSTSYSKAKVWGSRYFKNNFKRLAMVKGEVDPNNFFYHEQSIPPLIIQPLTNFTCQNDFIQQCYSDAS